MSNSNTPDNIHGLCDLCSVAEAGLVSHNFYSWIAHCICRYPQNCTQAMICKARSGDPPGEWTFIHEFIQHTCYCLFDSLFFTRFCIYLFLLYKYEFQLTNQYLLIKNLTNARCIVFSYSLTNLTKYLRVSTCLQYCCGAPCYKIKNLF